MRAKASSGCDRAGPPACRPADGTWRGGGVGLGLVGQQLVVGAYKTFIPFLGAVTTIPLVYGATTAVCAVMDAYFKAAARGTRISPEEMRTMWEREKARGEQEGRQREQDIRDEAERGPSDAP